MVDFNELLSVNIDDVKAPKALPNGTYFGTISAYNFGETRPKDGKTPTKTLHIDVQLTHPSDDVDADDLEGIDLAKKRLGNDFYLTEDAIFRLAKFLKSLGLEGGSLSELIPEIISQPVMVEVSKTLKKGTEDEFYNNIVAMTGSKD